MPKTLTPLKIGIPFNVTKEAGFQSDSTSRGSSYVIFFVSYNIILPWKAKNTFFSDHYGKKPQR